MTDTNPWSELRHLLAGLLLRLALWIVPNDEEGSIMVLAIGAWAHAVEAYLGKDDSAPDDPFNPRAAKRRFR